MRSPNWLEEEVMLALDLYVHRNLSWINKMSDTTFEIIALSKLLNGLNFHSNKPENFRSTGSIRMKIANFMSLDDKYLMKSLGNVGGLDRRVWEKYKNDPVSLHEECIQIISEHLLIRDDILNKYIKDMQLDEVSVHVDMDFTKYAESLKRTLTYYEKLAEKNTENKYAKKVIETCKIIYKSLDWIIDSDEVILDNYKEHAGINLKPIEKKKIKKGKQTEEKIGKLIKRTFAELIELDKLSEEMVSNLSQHKYCRDQFGIKHTFLIEIDEHQDFRKQLMDENGYVRYWVNPVLIRERKYCICKEWYENQRERYLRWLSTVNVPPFYMLNANELKKILEYLKENDSKKTCITKQEFVKEFPIETIEEVINILIEKGVLAKFQGSAREFVVDDYDALFRMLKKPEDYSGELL